MSQYHTDKYAYLDRYDQLFADLYSKPIKLLELGVFRGGSLRLWHDKFPRAEIFGVDHQNRYTINDKQRVKIFNGDQGDLDFLRAVVNQTGKLDVIIDDASHIGELTRKSFWFLFNYLTDGGLYVIEDWGTGYWPDWPDGRQPGNMVDFVKELIDEVGAKDSGSRDHARASRFAELRFYHAMAVVTKRW